MEIIFKKMIAIIEEQAKVTQARNEFGSQQENYLIAEATSIKKLFPEYDTVT